MTDLSEMLDAERKRLSRKPKTAEQRERERAARAWWKNLEGLWTDAYLLSNEELRWLATVTDATRDEPARISLNPWTGHRTVMRAPASWDDAVRAEKLRHELWQRRWEAQERFRRDGRKHLAERLRRLGLQAERYTGFDRWAYLDEDEP